MGQFFFQPGAETSVKLSPGEWFRQAAKAGVDVESDTAASKTAGGSGPAKEAASATAGGLSLDETLDSLDANKAVLSKINAARYAGPFDIDTTRSAGPGTAF
jgi:hypothetical protein